MVSNLAPPYYGDPVEIEDNSSDTGVTIEAVATGSGISNLNSVLRSKTINSYNNLGEVYRTNTYQVNQGSGTASTSNAVTNTFYDNRGNVIASVDASGVVTKNVYNGLDQLGGQLHDRRLLLRCQLLECRQQRQPGHRAATGREQLRCRRQRHPANDAVNGCPTPVARDRWARRPAGSGRGFPMWPCTTTAPTS